MIELKRVNDRRKFGIIPHIIINHSIDLKKVGVINTEKLLDTTVSDTWSIRKVSRDEYNYDQDAYHLLIEQIGRDFLTVAGCPLHARNPFLKDLIENDVLDEEYRESILITMHGDYSFDIFDKKLNNELAFRILELKNLFKVPVSKIVFLSEIINENANKKLKVPFGVVPMTKVSRSDIMLYMTKFGK